MTAALARLDTWRPAVVLASIYRHLAHWPPHLSLARPLLTPLESNGRLAATANPSRCDALAQAERLLVRLGDSAYPPLPGLAAAISSAIEPFVKDVIVKTLLICAILCHVTA